MITQCFISEPAEPETVKARMLKSTTVTPGKPASDVSWPLVWDFLVEENSQIPTDRLSGPKVEGTAVKCFIVA
jgi:hypothetical protein